MNPKAARIVGCAAAWLLVAIPLSIVLFLHSSTTTVMASHDAEITPTFDSQTTVDLGPYLPNLRMPSGGRVGVRIELGKTSATSYEELVQRYAVLGSRPKVERHRITGVVRDLAIDSGLRAGAAAAVPVGVWLLLGVRRRRELARLGPRSAVAVAVCVAIGAVVLSEPWRHGPEAVEKDSWTPLTQAMPELPIPADLAQVEIQKGLITQGTRRLVASAFDTYDRSVAFYSRVAEAAGGIGPELHQPAVGETVGVLVTDRHDNIGMDKVVRAVADEAGATAVLDGGDDTSTGEPWEAFSLDSLNDAFKSYDARIAIAGNHDNGTFVSDYLEDLGWSHLDKAPIIAIDGVRVWGVDDPRSSGLGTWRDEKGLSFDEIKQRVGDAVCKLDEGGERVALLLVHDANLGGDALSRGCVDLVAAGHIHSQLGPDRVVGENGKAGYTYTNGTTGGAAYAMALGSKLRRDAEFTFLTFRDGRPVGIQPVTVRTTGDFLVGPYQALDLG